MLGGQRALAEEERVAAPIPLYAWVTPAFSSGSPVDHTWVTTYDNRVTAYPNDPAVAGAGESYWYCWGSFHPTGGTPPHPDGFLARQPGDLAFAQCLVLANADSATTPPARGTIFTYGVDGVCHQLANQVLYATEAGGAAPLAVVGARGYIASSFIYGTYGLQHAAWAAKIASCRGGQQPVSATFTLGGTAVSGLPDDFEARARAVLGADDPKALNDLLALRAETHRFSAQAAPGFAPPPAEALNLRNQHLLDQAALLLGPDRFRQIFGFSPEERIDLVDPTVRDPDRKPIR
jgi:hypothetical protein